MIVANDEYEHEGMKRLRAPAADAEALGRVLGDPQIGAFDVRVVRNEPAHVVQQEIEDVFAESRPEDVILLHFSCHGLKSESGELFLAARNTRPTRLGSTAVPADFVQRCMRASRSRSIVLLLDCCYGGAFARGVTVRASGDVHVLDSFPAGKLGGGRGRAVITASSSTEYAFEDNTLADDHSRRPSVFTAAVVEGLATGDADRDEDGWVSLNELYDYVFDRVRHQNPHQTPSRDVEMQGELYLARSRRKRLSPLPIPPHLEAARTDQNTYTRLGAISELRSRLAGDDQEAALGAREALVDTARTDIRTVAEQAKAALGEAVLRVAETELHFGRVEQGAPPPHHTVRLLGPPLARVCTPHPSDDWIRVDVTADGLDVSIDTAGVGAHHGGVEVRGPVGEAIITIGVDLVPRLPQPSPPPPASLPPAPPPPPAGGSTTGQVPAAAATTNTAPMSTAPPGGREPTRAERHQEADVPPVAAPPPALPPPTPRPGEGTARAGIAPRQPVATPGRRGVTWSVLSAPFTVRTWRETAHLLLNPLVGIAGLCVVLATLSLAAGWVGMVERGRAAVLLHEHVSAPPPPGRRSGVLGTVRVRLTDPSAWRRSLYLILYLLIIVLPGGLVAEGVGLLWGVGPWSFSRVNPLLALLFCLSVLFVTPWVVRCLAVANRALVRTLLGPARAGEVSASRPV